MDNLISRRAVLDLTWEEPSYTDALNVLTEIRDKIKGLPSIQPVTGKWETDEVCCSDGYKYTVTYCSECDEQVDYMTNYCPNCGAKMEVKE